LPFFDAKRQNSAAKNHERVREERPGFVPIKKSLISATPSIILAQWIEDIDLLCVCLSSKYCKEKYYIAYLRRITHGSHFTNHDQKHIKNVIFSQVQMCDTDRRLIFLTIPDKIPKLPICQQMDV